MEKLGTEKSKFLELIMPALLCRILFINGQLLSEFGQTTNKSNNHLFDLHLLIKLAC